MGTLGKALGASGGYICGSRALIDFLVNRARSFIFSTAPVPAAAAAATAGIQLVQSDEGKARPRKSLRQRVTQFNPQSAIRNPQFRSAIIPIIIGDESKALNWLQDCANKTFLFPPSVIRPWRAARRGCALTLTAAHSTDDVAELLDGLEEFEFMNKLAELDRKFVWHPFTQMRDWLKREPIVIASGHGAVLRDVNGANISTPILPSGPICTAIIIPKSTRPSAGN